MRCGSLMSREYRECNISKITVTTAIIGLRTLHSALNEDMNMLYIHCNRCYERHHSHLSFRKE